MQDIYSRLLIEYNEQRIINDFGKKLLTKFMNEKPSASPTVDYLLGKIKESDPTPNKEYAHWIVGNYVRDSIQRWEDLGRVQAALTAYQKLKNKKLIPNELLDINKLNFDQLQDVVEKYTPKDAVLDNDKEIESDFYKKKEATLFYNDDEIKVVIPHTEEASMFFGRNTRWCTAAKNHNQFDGYNKRGPLYIVLIKKENKRFQFHWPSQQFMNEHDQNINTRNLADKYPKLWDIFTPVAEKNTSLILNKNPREAMQLAAIAAYRYGHVIRHIKNPSEAVQLSSVNYYPSSIQYIDNPNETVQLAAVNQDGGVIRHIKNPSEAVQLAAVNSSGEVIRHIKNPSKALQLAAIKQSGYAIKYINDQSESMQLIAVNTDCHAIKYIKNPSEAVQLKAVKADPLTIKYIKNPSEAVQLKAVKADPTKTIKYIKNPSEAVQLIAVKADPLTIKYIKNPSESVQLIAVRQKKNLIRYIENPTEKVKELVAKKKLKESEQWSDVQRAGMVNNVKPYSKDYWLHDGNSAEVRQPFLIGSLVQSLLTKRYYSVIGYDSHNRVIVAANDTKDRKRFFSPEKLRAAS